jgi:hypothetical protein
LRRGSALELRSIDVAEACHGVLNLWRLGGAARSPVSAQRHQDRHALICAAADAAAAVAAAVEVDCRLVDLHQMHARPDRYSFLARLGKRDGEGKGSSTEASGRQADFGGETGCMGPEGRKVDLQGTGSGGRLNREEISREGIYCVSLHLEQMVALTPVSIKAHGLQRFSARFGAKSRHAMKWAFSDGHEFENPNQTAHYQLFPA